jgi:hypothetical protein
MQWYTEDFTAKAMTVYIMYGNATSVKPFAFSKGKVVPVLN